MQRATQRFDREVDRGISAFLKPGERVAPKIKVHTFDLPSDEQKPGHSYSSRVESVTKAVANADQHVGNARTAVDSIAAHAPGVALGFQSAALRATTYLHEQIPPGHVNVKSLTPQASNNGAGVPHYAKAEFNRKYNVVNGGPAVVLDKLSRGALTKGEVDAADAVYPAAMSQIRQKVMEKLSESKKPLPMSKQMQLTQVLGLPREGTVLDPKFVASMQSLSTSPAAGQPKPPSAPKRSVGTVVSDAATLTGQGKV